MNVRNLEVVCKDKGREDKKAITSRRLHQEVVEVPFLQHFCPFFFITTRVAALLISQHTSLHYQLWWWEWWWVLFTAGILWKAQQMNNNYSDRNVEAKKDKWLKWGYCVLERQGGNLFWSWEQGWGWYFLSQGLSCCAGLEQLIWGTWYVLEGTDWTTMSCLNHKLVSIPIEPLASSAREESELSLSLCSKNNSPQTMTSIHPPLYPAFYLSIWGSLITAIL